MAGSLCRRIGPGRLPYASRRDTGGGIAMGATAALAIVVWYGSIALAFQAGALTGASADGFVGFAVAASLLVVPLAVPSAFVAATALWRYLHPGGARPLLGALLGAVTAIASTVGGAVGFGLLVGASNVADGTMAVLEALGFALVMTPLVATFAALLGGWLILPLGAFGGWYHERAKRSA